MDFLNQSWGAQINVLAECLYLVIDLCVCYSYCPFTYMSVLALHIMQAKRTQTSPVSESSPLSPVSYSTHASAHSDTMTDLRASGKILFGLVLLETWIGFIHTLIDREPLLHETSLVKPKVVIVVLARNSEHSLPYFLGCIERLDYPKDRISIW